MPGILLHLIRSKKARLSAGFFCFFFSLSCWGEASIGSNGAADPLQVDQPALVDQVAVDFDEYHQSLTEKIIQYSSSVDSFFSNERQNIESNKSRLLIGWSETFYEGGDHFGTQIIDAKLHLPQTQNRLRIDVTAGQSDEGDSSNTSTPGNEKSGDESDLSVGLGLLLKAKEWVNFRLSGGVRFQGGKISAYAVTRLRLSTNIGAWSSHLTETLERDSLAGIQLLSRLDFERPLSDVLKFRSTTQRTDYFDPEYETANHNLFLFQSLGDRRSLIYQLGIKGVRAFDEDEMSVTSYYAAVHFRRRIYRRWIFLDIIPQRIYSEENDFKPVFALTLQLSAVIGHH
jgi:hypothetical protein